MNKYLIKIAEKQKEEIHPVRRAIGAAALGVYGHSLVTSPYHNGDLTGRATYYHGSTKENVSKIKQDGIVPRKSHGIIDVVHKNENPFFSLNKNFAGKNENLAFATKTKAQAHSYAAQADSIRDGKYTEYASNPAKIIANSAKHNVLDSTGIKKDTRVVKVNIPTWRENVKRRITRNPELDNPFIALAPGAKKELGDNTLTHKGTINRRYIKGSSNYKPNSSGEILKYIKNNSKRFAKGTASVAAGSALVGLAGHLLTSGHKDKK